MKRLPPRPLLVSLVMTSVLVWAVARSILSAGARLIASRFGVAPELSPLTIVLLAVAVSWVVLLDLTVSRERVFVQNLGVAPLTIQAVAVCAVLACEAVLVLAWPIFSLVAGS